MSSLIVPCAGKSTRYPGVNPKYLLTHPNGGLLVLEGLKGFDFNKYNAIYVTILREHDKAYKASEIISNAFKKAGLADKLVITVLDKETKSQPETVALTIELNSIKGSVLIKDCDDYFVGEYTNNNAVYYHSLSQMSSVNASNKSYITTNNSGYIDNIVEKRVISEDFCCGGYSFADAQEFVSYYNRVKNHDNLYISHIIYVMLMHGISFTPVPTNNYYDWGTLQDWQNYRAQYKTLFVDLDGVLVENSSEYSSPKWGTTSQLDANCQLLRKLYNEGMTQIIITTARSEEYKKATLDQLRRENIPYHNIIFGLYHAKRYIINDYSTSNSYPSCEAINLIRNSDNLNRML